MMRQETMGMNWSTGHFICTSGTTFYFEGDQEPAQAVQGHCGVSVLGDIKNPSGYGPGQSAPGGLPQARAAQGDLQGSLPGSASLWFSDSDVKMLPQIKQHESNARFLMFNFLVSVYSPRFVSKVFI